MMTMPMMSVCGPNCWNGLVKPSADARRRPVARREPVVVALGEPAARSPADSSRPCPDRGRTRTGTTSPSGMPSATAGGCPWRTPFRPLPLVLIDRMSYTYGDRVGRPVVVAVQQADVDADVEPAVSAEGQAVEALELPRRGVDRLLAGERRTVPAAPLRAAATWGPWPVSEPPLTYSAPLCQARPATNCGDPGISVPGGVLQQKHAAVRHGVLDSTPPSPSNTFPPPKANEVGV